jgi:Co/Zn/Cd efflux system component
MPMAHHQRAVRTAVLLNAGIFGVELIAGWQASSLSLIMDGIHNFSDQLAMVAIWLAFLVSRGPAHSNAKRPLIPTDGGQDSN